MRSSAAAVVLLAIVAPLAGAAGAHAAFAPRWRHLSPAHGERPAALARRRVGGLHRHHRRFGEGQVRYRHLDDELGRHAVHPAHVVARGREHAAVEPRRPLPRLRLRPPGGQGRPGVAPRPPRRRGAAAHHAQGWHRGLRLVAGREAARARARRGHRLHRAEGYGREEDAEADRHRPLQLQARHRRLPRHEAHAPRALRHRDEEARHAHLASAHDDSPPSWSPDGQRIAFVREPMPEPGQAARRRTSTSSTRARAPIARQLTDFAGPDGGRPAWSARRHVDRLHPRRRAEVLRLPSRTASPSSRATAARRRASSRRRSTGRVSSLRFTADGGRVLATMSTTAPSPLVRIRVADGIAPGDRRQAGASCWTSARCADGRIAALLATTGPRAGSLRARRRRRCAAPALAPERLAVRAAAARAQWRTSPRGARTAPRCIRCSIGPAAAPGGRTAARRLHPRRPERAGQLPLRLRAPAASPRTATRCSR